MGKTSYFINKTALGLFLLVAAGCAPVVRTTGGPAQTSAHPEAQMSVPVRTAADASLRVGLLLPLSGAQAKLGQGMVEAAQLALYESNADGVGLLMYDTQGDPALAAQAARKAIADGAQILIGPIFSAELDAVDPIAQTRDIPILSLSNNTDKGDINTFIFGFAPDEQVERILTYAKQQGVQKVAAFIPQSTYGDTIAVSFDDHARQLGLALAPAVRFDAANFITQSVAFTQNVKNDPSINAIFAPLAPSQLVQFIPQLGAAGIEMQHTYLLGLSTWESLNSSTATAAPLMFFPAPEAVQRRAFINRYQQSYGYAPSPISSLAYDATALVVVLAKNYPAAPFRVEHLTDPQGFSGVDGIFRLHDTGIVERGLAVYRVTPEGTRLVQAAPDMFSESSHH